MTDPAAEKAALRQRMRGILRAIPPEDGARRSLALCDRLAGAPDLARARSVLLTLPLPGEADLTPLAQRLLDRGCAVCLARVDWDARTMTPVRIDSLSEGVVAGRHGVRQPVGGVAVALGALDAILVPGLAFDLGGGRLGRGGGFFDRLLGEARRGGRAWVCGAGFDCQIVDRVPGEAHDERLDAIASESGVAPCRGP